MFGQKKVSKRILEKARLIRDMIEISGDQNLDMNTIRETLRDIARDVAGLSDLERVQLAKQIDDIFDEKISIIRGLKENRVRRIRSMLKEITMMKRVPRSKMNRVKMIDSQIKLDDAMLTALENIRDILIETVQRGVDPEAAWNKVFRITNVVEGYVERLTERAEAFSEIAEEEVSPAEVEAISEQYGVKEPKKVEGKELKKMLEKYGLEE